MAIDNSLVSIIMNCHNGSKYLNESIESILNKHNNWLYFAITLQINQKKL